MTGIWTVRLPVRLTALVRTTLEPRPVRTARVGADAAVAGPGGTGAGTAALRRVGAVTCGKRAAGSASSGITAGAGRASTAERIASAEITAYGRASESAHARANQNRMRRVPRLLRPNAPAVPKPCAPENAGVSRLTTCTHPADPHWRIPPTPGAPERLVHCPDPKGTYFLFFKMADRRDRSQYRSRTKAPASR